MVDEIGAAVGVAFAALGYQQDRSRAADLVVDGRAGDGQGSGPGFVPGGSGRGHRRVASCVGFLHVLPRASVRAPVVAHDNPSDRMYQVRCIWPDVSCST